MGLHEHIVVLETIDLADECHWPSDEIHDLRNSYEGMRLSVHCLNFLCHFKLIIYRVIYTIVRNG